MPMPTHNSTQDSNAQTSHVSQQNASQSAGTSQQNANPTDGSNQPTDTNQQDTTTIETLLKQLERERELNKLVVEYAQTMGAVYPLAISLDYKNDSYQMIEYDNFLNKTAASSGTIDELIRVGASTIPDVAIAKQFWELFNREAVIKAFKRGENKIFLHHPQNGDDGKIHYMNTMVVCSECSEENIKAISISRCVDKEIERKQAVEETAMRQETIDALADICATIVDINLQTREYYVIKNVKLTNNVLSGNRHGIYDDWVDSVVQFFIAPEMQEDMRAFFDIDTLEERLKESATVSTDYKSRSGRWYRSRFIAKKSVEEGVANADVAAGESAIADADGAAGESAAAATGDCTVEGATARVEKDAHVSKVLFVAREITTETKKEQYYLEKLRAIAQEAELANQSKTNFLRRMSHDIRTPLNGIIGMLKLMDSYEGDKEKYREYMDKLKRSADYLLSIVNNVLDVGKMETGEIELEYRPFDLGQLLLNTLPIVATNASQHSVIFIGGREDSHVQHRYVIGSPVHLNRLLMNIASNAVKYNRSGGGLKLYCNEIECDGEQAVYEFVCEDTGLGMSEEFQKQAFEPYTQEGKETTTSFTGSGLGLSIVKKIVDKMGGTIELTSKENVGTTVRIVIAFMLDKNPEQSAIVNEQAEKLDLSGRKALLVEDNEINMEIARALLEEIGLEIVDAENGKEAIDIFIEKEPYTFDYIFMDMMMPVMDGLEATRTIRALSREDAASVPIIAMTANAFTEDRRACIEAGMNDHVGKPINSTELMNALKRFAK